MEYEALKQQQALEKQQYVQDKYAETLAKVYVEFGKTVYPLVQAYAHALEYLTPNSKCDQSCLIDDCLRPGLNTDVCFTQCGCNFDKARFAEELKNYENESDVLVKKGVDEVETIVKAIQEKEKEFKQKELQFTYKYYDLLEKHAVNAAGCEASCVDQCTNPSKYTLYQVEDCLEKCDCSGGAL